VFSLALSLAIRLCFIIVQINGLINAKNNIMPGIEGEGEIARVREETLIVWFCNAEEFMKTIIERGMKNHKKGDNKERREWSKKRS
jgi:hypothetical protein